MALVSLFFQTRAKISQLDLDVSISETHRATAKLTQIETEDAETVTDGVVLDPKVLVIEGAVSKTPLGGSALVASAAIAGGGLVGKELFGQRSGGAAAALVGAASIGGLISNAFGLDDNAATNAKGGKSREPGDVYEYLCELRDKRVPFDVITALREYKSMLLTSVEATRTSQTTGMLRFTATLEQIKIVKAQVISVDVSSLGGAAAETNKLGKQGPTAASAKVSDDTTALYRKVTTGSFGIPFFPGF